MTDTNKALEAFQRIETSLRIHLQDTWHSCKAEDDLNLVRAALSPDAVVIPREEFERAKHLLVKAIYTIVPFLTENITKQREDTILELCEVDEILTKYGEKP